MLATLRSVLDRATRLPLLTLIAALQALGMAAVAVRYWADLALGGVVSAGGTLKTGDFMAFYTAGRMVWLGRGAELYDLSTQRALQSALVGSRQLANWQPYVNPPLLALLLAPLGALPYLAAFYAFCALMCLSLALALGLLAPYLPEIRAARRGWLTAALLVIGFHPLLRTAIGGQNTPLSLLLLAATFAAWQHRPRSWLAGLPLGLLGFKPQLALGPALLLLLRRSYGAIAVAAAVSAVHYAIAAWFLGAGWPRQLLATLGAYRPLEWASNLHTHFSLPAVAEQLLPRPYASVLAAALVLALLGGFAWRAGRHGLAPTTSFGLAVVVAMLASPHLQYYDVGLLVLPVLVGVATALRRTPDQPPSLRARLLLALAYHAYPVYQLGPRLGIQPLVLWPLGIGLWLARWGP